MEKLMVQATISKEQAASHVYRHRKNFIMRWSQLFAEPEVPVSMELLYLPYWCYDYQYQSAEINKKISGKVAVETWKQHTAILPDNAQVLPLADGFSLLKASGSPDPEYARKQLYWEAFGREKKRKSIQIEITDTNLLYAPYWIVYVEGKQVDIVVVDAMTGKIDLGMKEAVMHAIMASRE
ncbi:hypothetical protein BBI11_08895 [Planococcus maritimus]|uniref:hypothetical protein n=1 Tax=Planococcus maritimus TaxID=192421 RepID=UPI00080F27EA|nr:hypothetical protein [Planococcus maritimus]ANU17128.1 hypothetical protein BBI11_08895 [Planococcus maritimus]